MYDKSLIETSIKENIIKNAIIILLTFLFFTNIQHALQSLSSDKIGNFLTVLSILIVTVCFANFAFSYEFTAVEKLGVRMLAHFSTFIFMLLTALLLEALVISINIVYPSLFSIILSFSILLYLGVALYDFWDFFRVFNKK